ncbi:cysteine synthase [Rhizobium sp. BK312]|uniref:hypothetical protein n=1 Tax=Rhizobium sp. BK312 TaxID=2587080 RepID=UPI00161475B8|nr:hypothetical protein [Rhizobium sp. BK312]MBB3428941.1 cysteine synthase [Rhizobium sp. BK312]
MTKTYQSFSKLIGNTPLLELRNYRRMRDLGARIVAIVPDTGERYLSTSTEQAQ